MNVLVVGAKGALGSALVDLMIGLGQEVLCVDLDTIGQLEGFAKKADVVFLAVPVSETAKVASMTVKAMRPGTLLVSGSSVALPASPNKIDLDEILARGIIFAHLHLHFRPIIPLRATIFGENITLWIEGDDSGKWEQWISEQLLPFGPFLHKIEQGEHDQVTIASQLFHMITAILMANLWRKIPARLLGLAVKIGGFPCQSIVRSALRSLQRPDLILEIIDNHPESLAVLETLEETIADIKQAIGEHNLARLGHSLGQTRSLIKDDVLTERERITDELIRLEADFRKPKVTLDFPAEMNHVGLLAKVLAEFDRRGIDKTSTFARNLPNGGCRFIIGVEKVDWRVQEAVDAVKSLVTSE